MKRGGGDNDRADGDGDAKVSANEELRMIAEFLMRSAQTAPRDAAASSELLERDELPRAPSAYVVDEVCYSWSFLSRAICASTAAVAVALVWRNGCRSRLCGSQ
jgi:hypothetical protein